MGLKKIFGICMGCLLMANIAFAQEVTVDGVGVDKDSAVRDAMRNAVENVIGTYIDSRTLVDKSVVALDEIYAKSQGFVKNINILNENRYGGEYRVTARIDVDTNPNAQLMNRLNMIMLLNDPRIAVVVVEKAVDENMGGTRLSTDDVTESAMNEKLLDLGFTHIVDPQVVAKLKVSSIISGFFNGENNFVDEGDNYGIDYLVLGKANTASIKIMLPGKDGGDNVETLLTTGRADLSIRIIKFDTGDIVSTYNVEGQAVDNSGAFATKKALKVAAVKACEKIETSFKKMVAQPFSGMKFIVSASDESLIDDLVVSLRKTKGVQNVIVRDKNGEKTILEVESAQKPHALIKALRDKTDLGIFVEKISNSSVELNVS